MLCAVDFWSNGLKSCVNVTPVFDSSMSGCDPTALLLDCVPDEQAPPNMTTAAATRDNHGLYLTARFSLLLGPLRAGFTPMAPSSNRRPPEPRTTVHCRVSSFSLNPPG